MKKLVSICLALALTLGTAVGAYEGFDAQAFFELRFNNNDALVAYGDGVYTRERYLEEYPLEEGESLQGRMWALYQALVQPAVPQSVNNRLMVPVRPVAEAVGFAVDYQEGGTVTCVKGDTVVTFALGSPDYTVTQNGVTQALTLDTPAYAKDGRTYLPLRPLAEALDCMIIWNDSLKTAQLADWSAQQN